MTINESVISFASKITNWMVGKSLLSTNLLLMQAYTILLIVRLKPLANKVTSDPKYIFDPYNICFLFIFDLYVKTMHVI